MNITITLNRFQAVDIFRLFSLLQGESAELLLRQKLQEKIIEAWPEITQQGAETHVSETRTITVTRKELRAVASGIVDYLGRRTPTGGSLTTGGEFSLVRVVAQSCKIWKWVESQIDTDELPEFEEELDDEAPLVDDSETVKS